MQMWLCCFWSWVPGKGQVTTTINWCDDFNNSLILKDEKSKFVGCKEIR